MYAHLYARSPNNLLLYQEMGFPEMRRRRRKAKKVVVFHLYSIYAFLDDNSVLLLLFLLPATTTNQAIRRRPSVRVRGERGRWMVRVAGWVSAGAV